VVTAVKYRELKRLKTLVEEPTFDLGDVTFLLGSDLWTRVVRDQLACSPMRPWLREAMSVRYLSVIAFLLNGSEG